MPISQPPLIEVPFAESGLKNAIPANANNITGNAGFDLGFPPINLTAVAAGGIPPYGQDMNGILYEITQNLQYQQTGTAFVYDAAFAAAIGGYPVGATLNKLDGSGWWINTLSGNTSDPDLGGSDWLDVPFTSIGGSLVIASQAEAETGTNNTKAMSPLRTTQAISASMASSAEAEAGTSNTKLLSPLTLRNGLNAVGSAPVAAARAYVNFNGTGTVAIRKALNVSSITDNGIGDYTVNFATALPDADYIMCDMVSSIIFGGATASAQLPNTGNALYVKSTTAVRFFTSVGTGVSDSDQVMISVFD